MNENCLQKMRWNACVGRHCRGVPAMISRLGRHEFVFLVPLPCSVIEVARRRLLVVQVLEQPSIALSVSILPPVVGARPFAGRVQAQVRAAPALLDGALGIVQLPVKVGAPELACAREHGDNTGAVNTVTTPQCNRVGTASLGGDAATRDGRRRKRLGKRVRERGHMGGGLSVHLFVPAWLGV